MVLLAEFGIGFFAQEKGKTMDKWTKVTMVAVMLMIVAAAMVSVSASAQATEAQAAVSPPSNAELAATIAKEMEAKNLSAAIAASRALETSSERDGTWAANTSTLARLLWQAGKQDEAIAFLKACAAEPKRSQWRTDHISFACNQLWGDPTHADELLAIDVGMSGDTLHNVLHRYNLCVSRRNYDDALAVALKGMKANGLGPEWARYERLKLLAYLRRADAAAVEALEYVKISTHPMYATAAMQHLLPGDDVALCVGLTAQQVLDARKTELRRSTGRLAPNVLTALANQLTKGGDERPLRVSDEAKALADKLGDAPLAGYLQPLLRGDHKAAFRYAYARAKAADTDADYVTWINAAAGAIRCADQCYNSRALQFIQYVNGTTDTNPATDLEVSK